MSSLFPFAVAFSMVLAGTAAIAAGVSIESARSAADNTAVVVNGVVSVPSGSFDPNDLGFAIQDGQYGIYIHDSLGGDYQLGQEVTVAGTVANNFGQVWGVTPTSITVTGAHPVHPAKPLSTGAVGEESEGKLIRVTATVLDAVFDDAPYGRVFHVNDGSGELTVFVYTGSGVDTSGIEVGDELSLTGFSGQFLDHFELNPRIQSDIVKL